MYNILNEGPLKLKKNMLRKHLVIINITETSTLQSSCTRYCDLIDNTKNMIEVLQRANYTNRTIKITIIFVTSLKYERLVNTGTPLI